MMISGKQPKPGASPKRIIHQLWIGCLLLLTSVLLVGASDLKYGLVKQDVVMARLQNAPMSNNDRVLALEKMFRDAGCQPTEQAVKHLRQPNVLCVLPGSTNSTIVVGGHLDHVEEGTGVVDDWSGAAMLPSLYQSLASQPRTHTFLFIGFAGEEEGLVGSEFYAKHLDPEDRKRIVAMVNLECLGIGPTEVWSGHSEAVLVRMLVAMAQLMKVPINGINMDRGGTAQPQRFRRGMPIGRNPPQVSTDSESFAEVGIPRITITAITNDTWPLLHSSKDNIKAINADQYYESYRLIAPYLALLDEQLPTDGSPIGKGK
jgi:Peptidase family M28